MPEDQIWRIARALETAADAFEQWIAHWIKIHPTPDDKTKQLEEKLQMFKKTFTPIKGPEEDPN